MELYYVVSVVDRSLSSKLISIIDSMELSVVLTHLGRGTATSEHLKLNDLEPSEKAVISTIASSVSVKQFIKAAKRKLFIDIPGNGIVMSIPIKSVGGGKTLAYFTDGQSIGEEKPDMQFGHELIIVILNEGYSDVVMDSARSVGATGGTVIHAKGTGRTKSERFFGMSLAEEKDVVYILASSKNKSDIMKSIARECGVGTPVGAICFSLPVSEVAGLRRLDDD